MTKFSSETKIHHKNSKKKKCKQESEAFSSWFAYQTLNSIDPRKLRQKIQENSRDKKGEKNHTSDAFVVRHFGIFAITKEENE